MNCVLRSATPLLMSVLLAVFAVARIAAGPPQQSGAITIQGLVKNYNEAPVPDASVTLQEKGQTNSQQAKTNAAGKFSFSIPHAGTYTLVAEKEGLVSRVSDPIDVAAGQSKSVQIALDASTVAATANDIEFADKPNFTVAGVTDWSGAGGHGSDTSLRTSEALARDTLALKSGATGGSVAATAAGKKADAHHQQGELDEKSGDALGAVREFEQAATLDPSEQNYFAWGTELLLHRAVSPAAVVFKKGAQAHRDSARMLAGLGAALYSAGSYTEAADALCRASDLEPNNAAPYLFIGKVEITAAISLPCGDEKLARFLLQQPGNALANYYYAMVLLKRDRESKNTADTQRAQALLEKTVAIDPKLGEAYLQLGILYAGQSDTQRAVDALTKAGEVAPNLSEAHYRLSQIYKRAGDKTKAEQQIQLYRESEKKEADAVERQRHEVQQFLIIMKEPSAS